MKVESIAECSLGAFCNTFDLHYVLIGLENQFLVFVLSGCLRQVLLYNQLNELHITKSCLWGPDLLHMHKFNSADVNSKFSQSVPRRTKHCLA